MRKNNKTCLICGEKYTYCSNCSEFKRLPKWKNIVCSDDCWDIYEIVNKYSFGYMDKAVAKEALQKLNITNKKLNDKVKEIIDEILSSNENTTSSINEVSDTVKKKRTTKNVDEK